MGCANGAAGEQQPLAGGDRVGGRRCGERCARGNRRSPHWQSRLVYVPTVLEDVPLHAMVMHEEPFGPIAPCLLVDSMDEALAINNSLSTGHAP